MRQTNRYLVWWQSRVSGHHYESKSHREAAERLLAKRERREHFLRGLVVDMGEYTMDRDEFEAVHRGEA